MKPIPIILALAALILITSLALADDPAVEVRIRRESGAEERLAIARPATVPTTIPATQPAPRPDPIYLGVNLEGLTDYSRNYAFRNVIRESRRFGSATKPFDGSAALDPRGFPTGAAGTIFRTEAKAAAINGTYKIRFTGRAPLTGSDPIAAVIYDPATNRTSAEMRVSRAPPDATINYLSLSWGGPIGSDLVVLAPGYDTADATGPGQFRREFLDKLAPFGGIRMMDWLHTNGSLSKSFEDRPLPDRAQFTGPGGVPIEAAIDLANATNRDLYLNVPALWDPASIAKLVALVKARLNPDLNCYLEYANEVWNYQAGFAAYGQNQALTKAEIAAGDARHLATDTSNIYVSAWLRVAAEAMEIAKASGGDPRIRVVLASQLGYSPPGYIIDKQLAYIAKWYGGPEAVRKSLYAAACAPYYSLGEDDEAPADPITGKRPQFDARTTLTVEQVTNRMLARAGTNTGGEYAKAFHAAAARYGIRSIAYEGGLDLRGKRASLEAKIAAQYHPLAGAAVEKDLRAWFDTPGAGSYFYYNLSGRFAPDLFWPLRENGGAAAEPKYEAAKRVAESLRAR